MPSSMATREVLDAAARPRGLRGRILRWFLVLSLVPLILSNTVGYVVTRRILEAQARRDVLALSLVRAQYVAQQVERHQLSIDAVVAGNTPLRREIPDAAAAVRSGARNAPAIARLHERLDRTLADLPLFTELYALDATGLVVASTNHAHLGADWSATDLFHLGRVQRFFSEDLDAVGGVAAPVYRLAVPIRDDRAALVGLLGATVGFEAAQGFLWPPGGPAGDIHAYVIDGDGRPLVASPARAGLDYGRPLRSPLLDQPVAHALAYRNHQGIPVLGVAVPIPGRSWRYVAETPAASVLGPLRGLGILAAVLEGVFVLLLVAVVWIVARSIVTPLRRLMAAAERIRAGELGVEVQIARPDELGELGRTFNQMSVELRTSSARIRELHEQDMRRAAQLASVGELASGIAHEIKNPLVGLSSGLDLLGGRIGDDPKSDRILGQMRAQLERMDSALHDLLSYARPREPRLIWTQLHHIVKRVIGLITSQAEAAGVRVETRQVASAPDVRIDPELMTQALVNLALNGIQAMDRGGVLTFIIEVVGEDEVRLSIGDTGSGITEDRLGQVFRPFYTTKHRGSGLGLAITRDIVERHGGRLEVDSTVGVGSTFTLVLNSLQPEPAIA